MGESTREVTLVDERHVATGWPRVLFVVLAICAFVFAWRAIIAMTALAKAGEAWDVVVTLVAVLVWIVGVAGLIHNGRKMRIIATGAWLINLVMAAVGACTDFTSIHHVNPWCHGGATYYFVPTIGVIAALAWLMWSRPARLAARSGGR